MIDKHRRTIEWLMSKTNGACRGCYLVVGGPKNDRFVNAADAPPIFKDVKFVKNTAGKEVTSCKEPLDKI